MSCDKQCAVDTYHEEIMTYRHILLDLINLEFDALAREALVPSKDICRVDLLAGWFLKKNSSTFST